MNKTSMSVNGYTVEIDTPMAGLSMIGCDQDGYSSISFSGSPGRARSWLYIGGVRTRVEAGFVGTVTVNGVPHEFTGTER